MYTSLENLPEALLTQAFCDAVAAYALNIHVNFVEHKAVFADIICLRTSSLLKQLNM